MDLSFFDIEDDMEYMIGSVTKDYLDPLIIGPHSPELLSLAV